MMKRTFFIALIAFLSSLTTLYINAQVNAGDSVMNHVLGNRLSVGGYGEVVYGRNFYSDHVSRYSAPDDHKNDPSHGRFDIPHAVIYLGYDFGKGWCRTTPLWGRGLSLRLTGAEDRLHDCRARNEIEAIMWHGYSKQSDAYATTLKFYNLNKDDRDAVVKFIQAI